MSVKLDMSGITSFKFRIRNGMTQALIKGAEDIVQVASDLAPVDEGRLKQSGKVNVESANVVFVTFGNDLPDERAPAQEFGTIFMEAQPYLVPAMNQVDILFYMKQELGLGGKRG